MAALRADDLEVGMHVTVLRLKPREVPVVNPLDFLSGDGGVATRVHEDHSWYGDVLTVKAVDFPYVIVDGELSYMKGITLDMRQVELMKLTPEYIRAKNKELT